MAKRTTNYTSHERVTLISLINEYADIVEDKRTDSRTNRKKERVWETITTKYNAEETTRYRTTKQLQACWKNIKTRAKQKLTCVKHEPFETGCAFRVSPSADENNVEFAIQNHCDPVQNELDNDTVSNSSEPDISSTKSDRGKVWASIVRNSKTDTTHVTEEQQPSASTLLRLSLENCNSSTATCKRKTVENTDVLLQYKLIEHDAKMSNYRRELEIMEAEHNLKMEILQQKLENEKQKYLKREREESDSGL